MKIEYKIDPLTKEEFIPEKISQKFATKENRIKYNNIKAAKLRQERAFFDGPCKKSHKILKSLFEIEPEKSYNMHFLAGKGIDFTAYNNLVNTVYGKLPAFYNYALRSIPNTELYQIIKI